MSIVHTVKLKKTHYPVKATSLKKTMAKKGGNLAMTMNQKAAYIEVGYPNLKMR
jgi:hypothetical protein